MRDKSEEKIAKKLGGQLTNASGAVNDDGDIRYDKCIIECKRREGAKSITFHMDTWRKVRTQAVKASKMPVYIFQTRGNRFVMTYLDFMKTKTRPNQVMVVKYMPLDDFTEHIHIKFKNFWDCYLRARKDNQKKLLMSFQVATSKVEYCVLEFEDFKQIMEAVNGEEEAE